MIQKERFQQYTELLLFDCAQGVQSTDGYMELVEGNGIHRHLKLKDTVMHPHGWIGSKLEIAYKNMHKDTVLELAFGKPYANDPHSTSNLLVKVTVQGFYANDAFFPCPMGSAGIIVIDVSLDSLKVNQIPLAPASAANGYFELYCSAGVLDLYGIVLQTEATPFTQEEHNNALLTWRHQQLDRQDQALDALESYIRKNPQVLPKQHGSIQLPYRMVERGEQVTIRVTSYNGSNAAVSITHDCFSGHAIPEPIVPHWVAEGDHLYADIPVVFHTPGNTRIELWVGEQKIVRQVAVLAAGYMAVIPWIGYNIPYVDEELHRFDLPGDYWAYRPEIKMDPAAVLSNFAPYLKNYHKYGDRTVCFINGQTLLPGSETDSLFELDIESRRRGLTQMKRQMQLLGYDSMELIASYTPGDADIAILEELGVKGVTSLCAWQNWQDAGWKINHCGVSNQPYFPANDDFRRASTPRDLMCFTMGNASCDRNYSIMVYDSCPSNAIPGERYLDHYVIHQQVQRFYDCFDGYIADSKNNPDQLLTITVPIEAFRGRMDWNASNEAALRYMVQKAATEKIVFTSAAEVSDYHKRKALPMQEAVFFQPDYYYGYHNGTMPGRIGDRLECVTENYLAVIRRGSMLPLYFYDYTKPWDRTLAETTARNEFGLVDPDAHKPSECFPKQVYTEDMVMDYTLEGGALTILIDSETPKERMVSGIFDVPYQQNVSVAFDKPDVTCKVIRDAWTGNTHLFLDLGALPTGKTVIRAALQGTEQVPVEAENRKDLFAAMWFGDHAYLRSCHKETAIHVSMPAPEGAYLHLTSGERIYAADGTLTFTVNTAWFDESSILRNYPKELFAAAIQNAEVNAIGATTCSRWSGQ